MNVEWLCDCSEDMGPCESHMDVVVMREGASLRSADELSALFIEDAVSVGASLSPYGEDIRRRIGETEAWEGSWLRDPDLADAMRDMTTELETDIYTVGGFHVRWDDGYVIYTVNGGPLCD